jgi:hypothetical protein
MFYIKNKKIFKNYFNIFFKNSTKNTYHVTIATAPSLSKAKILNPPSNNVKNFATLIVGA